MRQPVPFGKYLLLDRISVGGMAEVFKAKSYGVEGFEKVIAIKRILPSMGEDKDFIKMFIDEAKIAGQLSHANIGQIFELGKHQGAHFIAMEYIWGKDLLQIQNRLRKLGELMPVAMASYIIAKTCEGLDYAHRKRDAMGRPLEIVHRDCSPQNILISYEGEVKIIDFGIARAASRSSRTNAGVLKGKFGYMSPEQVRGLPLDSRSDLFAVGTVFYESLTGERLFQGESDFSTLERVRNADVRSPTALNPSIPPEVEAIVMKSLARDPRSRYQTGGEMHQDIITYLTKQAVPFTGKTLADWLKNAFRDDLARERQMMEDYKRIAPDGSGLPAPAKAVAVTPDPGDGGLAGEPTTLGGPDLESMASPLTPPPRGKVVRAGVAADDYDEEGPTEIFGEIGSDLPAAAAMMRAPSAPSAQIAEVEADPGGHVAVRSDAYPPPPPMVATPTGMGVELAAIQAGGAAHLPSFYPVLQPGRAHAAESGDYSPYPPAVDRHGASGSTRAVTPRGRRRPAVGRDVAIGCAIAALVLAGFISAKFLLFGDEPRAQADAKTAAAATIAITVDGEQPAEVQIDGKTVGAVSSAAPLTLGGVEPGERVVRVVRAGAPPCEHRLTVAGDKIEVVRCQLGTPPPSGRLLLGGVGEGQRVFVDDMEISAEAAREAIPMAPNAVHTVVIKTGDDVVDRFSVELEPGEEMKREVAAKGGTSGKKPTSSAKTVEQATGDRRQATGDRRQQTGTESKPDSKTGSTAKPTIDKTTKVTPPVSNDPGQFTAYTKPWSRVYIDGKDTGKMTPIIPRSAIPLSPGSHKITFEVDGQKFDYRVTIEPGKTKNLVKVLPVK